MTGKERMGDLRDDWVRLVAAFAASSGFAERGCEHRLEGQ